MFEEVKLPLIANQLLDGHFMDPVLELAWCLSYLFEVNKTQILYVGPCIWYGTLVKSKPHNHWTRVEWQIC